MPHTRRDADALAGRDREALRSDGASGAAGRSSRDPLLFLVVMPGAGYRVEQVVTSDARGTRQPDGAVQDLAEQLDGGVAVHGAKCSPPAPG